MTGALATVLASRWHPEQGKRLVIGIGGGSGSGKSTVASLLSAGLRTLTVEVITQDRFFKPPEEMPRYHSTYHQAERPDFNHPDSFERDELIAWCRTATGHDVLIIEGILALHFPELLSLMHLRFYVSLGMEEMLARRTDRNLAAGYGGSREEIGWYNVECVSPQHRRYNAPTAKHADLLIPNDSGRSEERDRIIAQVCETILDLEEGTGRPQAGSDS